MIGMVTWYMYRQNHPSWNRKKVSYCVHISIKNLNIRKELDTNFDKTGKYTGIWSCVKI